MQMYAERTKDDEYESLVRAKTYEDLCALYSLDDQLNIIDDTLTRDHEVANGNERLYFDDKMLT
jgi:hypothetical protein